ncbi:MAG: hypothetical protein V3U94_01480, partial [Candidatus Thorarchaeota archaeon]
LYPSMMSLSLFRAPSAIITLLEAISSTSHRPVQLLQLRASISRQLGQLPLVLILVLSSANCGLGTC